MGVILKNDAYGYLSSAITDSATSIALTSGTGANFPSLGVSDYFYATIFQTTGISEIVKVTARLGDTLTVVRAQEGTTALAFPSGSKVELRVTAQSILDAIAAVGGGTGDVVGPASSVDNAVVRYSGTTGKLVKNSGVYINDANKVSLGSSTPVALTATITPQVQFLGTTISTSAPMVARYSANASQTFYYTAKSRGASVGAHAVLQDNDGLGGIAMFGSDGTNFVAGGEIYAEVNGTPGTGSMPADMVFRLNSVEKFRIFNDGVLSDDKGNLRAVPQSGAAKTGSYTLVKADIGRYIHVDTGGSVTIPDAVFEAGDTVTVINNTTGGITITCSITTAYISGTDVDKASVTLATRGRADILFISGTVCIISGSVT